MNKIKIRLKKGKKQSNYNKLKEGTILEVDTDIWDSRSSLPIRNAKILQGRAYNRWEYRYFRATQVIEVNLLHFEEIVDGDSYEIF